MGDGPLHFQPRGRGITRLWRQACWPSRRLCVKEIFPGEWIQAVVFGQRATRLSKHSVTRLILTFSPTYLSETTFDNRNKANRLHVHQKIRLKKLHFMMNMMTKHDKKEEASVIATIRAKWTHTAVEGTKHRETHTNYRAGWHWTCATTGWISLNQTYFSILLCECRGN